MKKTKLIEFVLLISTALIMAGCINQSQVVPKSGETSKTVIDVCIQACKDAKEAGKNLETGPCLLDPLLENKDWVCDVAHNPREQADNLPQNQCASYRQGLAHKFIEVTLNCTFIRTG